MHKKVIWCVLVGEHRIAVGDITSELGFIEDIFDDKVNFACSETIFAVRTRLVLRGPLFDARAAVQSVTIGANFGSEDHIEANDAA